MDLRDGVILRDYRIIRLLGEGGMGEVYLAEHTLLGSQVAIKRLNPALTKDAQFSERFLNEARIQAKLIHPNIVALQNFFVEDGVYYMVMEFAEGRMLKEVIAVTGPIPEQRSLNIFRQLVAALGYAHSKQIIHRDIKPSNIMLDASDNVKLMDFGIARLLSDRHMTRTGAKLGTLYYMSPEQVLADKTIDHRTDIYSAGIVLYEMLTGKLPYTADTDSDFIIMKEITEKRMPDPRDVYPHISDGMVAVLNRATQKQRDSRYQDCDDILQDCSGDERQRVSPAPVIPKPAPFVTSAGKHTSKASHSVIDTTEMVLVEGGTFNMGSDSGESDEKPVHQVTVSSFMIGKYLVTQEDWEEIMETNFSLIEGENLPVANVSWYDAIDYCNKRSLKEGLTPFYKESGEGIVCDWTSNGYRLPTEAEWEYAARGGNRSKGFTYSGSNDIDEVAWHEFAWYNGYSRRTTHSVGTKAANELGLFDMSGNVWEWCWDWYGDYSESRSSDPRGAGSGSSRVLRGGGWYNINIICRVSFRNNIDPGCGNGHVGVRVSRGYQ